MTVKVDVQLSVPENVQELVVADVLQPVPENVQELVVADVQLPVPVDVKELVVEAVIVLALTQEAVGLLVKAVVG